MAKTIKDLTLKELFEDLDYYINYGQVQSPPFVDKTYEIIKKYIKQIKELLKEMM